MKKLVWDDDFEEVDLGDGDYITIASAVKVGTLANIRGATTQNEVGMALLKALVKSWRGPSFTMPDGTPVPCSDENIERLELSVANEVSSRLMTLITGTRLDEESKKESTETSLST